MCTKNPKRTIVSNKPKRNSFDICESLALSSDEEEPRRPIIFSKAKPPKINPVCCPSCYCNEYPIAPLLFCGSKYEKKVEESRYLILNREAEGRKEHDTKFTRRRQNYENGTADYFVDLMSSDCKSERSDEDEVRRLKSDLIKFRKDNYFQCHSSGFLENEEHICVHNFTLNNRLKTQPKYPDCFGTSRCSLCFKPMEGGDAPVQRLSFNLGRQIIKIDVPEDLFYENSFKLHRRPQPTNSMALRYQKGVL